MSIKNLKTIPQGITQLIDVRTVTETECVIALSATEKERETLAERFEIPKITDFAVEGKMYWDDGVVFKGCIKARMNRISVVSLEEFEESFVEEFDILFLDKKELDSGDLDFGSENVYPISSGKINLGEALSEEFGVNLNPFPKKKGEYYEYHDQDDLGPEKRESPFSVLKKLTNK